MIEAPEEFLPLGSVVRLKGSDKKMMIIGLALILNRDAGETQAPSDGQAAPSREFYDYGLCLWPEGVMGDALVYSNHDCVSEVLSRGYTDESSEAALAQILEILPKMDIPRGNPMPADEW